MSKPNASAPRMKNFKDFRTLWGVLISCLTDVAADEQTQRDWLTEEEAQALRAEAARLDQLLADIAGKDGAPELKRRHRPNRDTAG
jgi:hypothetical protein